MAIYLTHQYGTRFYGPEPDLPQFDAKSFLAYSADYRTVHLSWAPPVGAYDSFRLLKSSAGYPANEDDGEILLDTATPDIAHNDIAVLPARFYYYSIFLKISGVWLLAATASCLHIHDRGSVRALWERLPIHYRLLRGNQLTLQADANEDLLRYIAVIGWGLDRVRTSIEAASYRADVNRAHIGLIGTIGDQLGVPRYGGLPGLRQRSLVANATPLLAGRGNTGTMQAAGRIVSGWDVVLRPSRNLLLSTDRAAMINPLPPTWDPSVAYKVGDRVLFFSATYICLVVATGYEQSPDGDRLTNTWWAPLLIEEDRTPAWDSASQSQHAWQPLSLTAGVANDKVTAKLILGAPRPADPVRSCNGVTLHNTHASAVTVAARALPADAVAATLDPLTPILHGIPIPLLAEWDATRTYQAGALVNYRGRCYHAVRPARLGVPPTTSTDRWQVVGTDRRVKITASAYTHQPHTDAAKPVAPATMFVDFYDDRGVLISREIGASADTRVLDTFNSYPGGANAALGGRTTEYGAKTWTDQVAGLIRDSYVYGVVRPATGNVRAMSTVNYGSADAAVATTMSTSAPAGLVQGLVLRLASSTSYVRATRTALQSVSGATVVTLVTYGTPIGDGERLTVKVIGSNYTVLRNGVQVATTTSSFNSSATVFGLVVE